MASGIKAAIPQSKGGMAALVIAFFIAFSVSFALITFPEFVVVDLVAGKEVPAVVKLPRKIVGTLVCNSAARGVGKIVGHIPIIGGAIHGAQEGACALNELFNVAESAGLNSSVREAFDCSTFKPSENPESGKSCSEESIGFEDGGGSSTAIPANARWLIPIYQKAAAYYKIPWPLLASLNKMETNYGQDLSVSSAEAKGWMQFIPSTWASEAVHAGEMPGQGSGCHYPTSKTPIFTGTVKADPQANYCNPVDAIFTAAHNLASDGAAGHTTWTGYTHSCEDAISKAVFDYNQDCNSISILGGICYGYVHCAHVFYTQIVSAETGSSSPSPGASPVTGGSSPEAGAGGTIPQIAKSQVGHGEEKKYWYFDPGLFGEEWCAAFASWVWHSAGVQHWKGTAGAGQFVEWGQEHGQAHALGSGYKPQPGDAIVYGYNGSGHAVHVGLVYQVFPNGYISSVAGNGAGGKVNLEPPFNPAEATAAGEPGPISYFVSPGGAAGSSGLGDEGLSAGTLVSDSTENPSLGFSPGFGF